MFAVWLTSASSCCSPSLTILRAAGQEQPSARGKAHPSPRCTAGWPGAAQSTGEHCMDRRAVSAHFSSPAEQDRGSVLGKMKEAKPGIWKQTDHSMKQALLLFVTVLGTRKLAACLLHPSPLAPTLPSPKLPHHSRFVARAQGTPVPSRAVGSCPVGGQMSASCSDLSPGPAPTSRFVSGALTVSVTAPIPLFSLG